MKLLDHPVPSKAAVEPPIVFDHVGKSYRTAAGEHVALRDVSLRIEPASLVAVVGRSGSGKSTLLNLVAGIDRPTSGSIRVAGTALESLDEGRLATWRGRTVGVVFQFFQLLPTLTVAENVALPMDFARRGAPIERRERALALLGRVGIADQADKLPATLSGGQQQRAAIARALANDPPIVLADEPTGNLDSETAGAIWELLEGLAAAGKTVVVVTHERAASRPSARVIELADGRVVHAEGGR